MGGSFFSETSWGFLIFQWKFFVCFLCNLLNSSAVCWGILLCSHLPVLVQDLDKCPQVSAFRDAEGLTDYLCHQFLLCQIQEGYLLPLQSSSRCLWWSTVLTCFSKQVAVQQVKLCLPQIHIIFYGCSHCLLPWELCYCSPTTWRVAEVALSPAGSSSSIHACWGSDCHEMLF